MNEPTKTQQLTQFLLSLTPDQRKTLGYLAENWPISGLANAPLHIAIAQQIEVLELVLTEQRNSDRLDPLEFARYHL